MSNSEPRESALTPPVSRDGFSYQDGVFYFTSDPEKHQRMDAAQLHDLLEHAPPKDWDANYYTAQMAHYGLKAVKTRGAAKKKLLAAFEKAGGDELDVPQAILDLEEELSLKWYKAEEARQLEAEPQSEEGKGKKRRAKYKEGRKMKKSKLDRLELPQSSDEDDREAEAGDSKMPRSLIQEKIEMIPLDVARKILTKILVEIPASADLVSKGIAAATLPDPSWTGKYSIDSEILFLIYEHVSITSFETYPSSTSGHLWAYFDFGCIAGVMRSVGKPPTMFNEEVHIEWRRVMNDSPYSGEFSPKEAVDPRNRGILTFLADGMVEAQMRISEPSFKFHFSGKLMKRNKTKNRGKQQEKLRGWKEMWRAAKNGGRTRPETFESPFESDTSDGHHQRKKKIGISNFLDSGTLGNDTNSEESEEEYGNDEWDHSE